MESVENSLKKLIVAVPAYNEKEGIRETIAGLHKIKAELRKKSLSLIVLRKMADG